MITERLESMSPQGFLRLMRQGDGDMVLSVGEGGCDGGLEQFATVEFCTPFSGGGGSSRTYAALIQLAAAMAADNLDDLQRNRRPPGLDESEQNAFVEWGKQCLEALNERLAIVGEWMSVDDGHVPDDGRTILVCGESILQMVDVRVEGDRISLLESVHESHLGYMDEDFVSHWAYIELPDGMGRF